MLRNLLQQVATDGRAEDHLLLLLRRGQRAGSAPAHGGGGGAAASTAKVEGAASQAEEVAEEEGQKVEEHTLEVSEGATELKCDFADFVSTAELCGTQRFRDYVLLSSLAERLAAGVGAAPPETLRRLGDVYSSLGVLNPPLFEALGRAHLAAWGSQESAAPSGEHLVAVARAFSAQRMRDQELFDVMAKHVAKDVKGMSPEQALSLLHSVAFLRLGDAESAFGAQGVWELLEQQATSPGLKNMDVARLAELCYVLVLSRRADERLDDLAEMYQALAGKVMALREADWASGEGPALHRRLLLLRSATRYLQRDMFKSLPKDVSLAFRRVHRAERPGTTPLRPANTFTRKMSKILTKLKIGHIVNAESGPFVFDIVERERKLVYECNHFDRFYVGSTEKIATMCLQERIVKAMGYKVIQVPHWHWKKIHHRKQRSEYLRMSRYYALKDRREIAPRDEVPTDVATNEFDYLGEYFFRKDMPNSSWSWFQPRYDYKRRLPGNASA